MKLDPTVAAVVRERTGVSWSRARQLCSDGRVSVDGAMCRDPAARISPQAAVVVAQHGPKAEGGPLSRGAIVHHDRDVVVVDKPAGLLSVADEAGNRETLAEYTRILLRRIDPRSGEGGLGVVHRLDRETSGLMLFTRTAQAKRVMAERFRAHDIDRVYWAIAHGDVPAKRVESVIALDRGDGLRGSRAAAGGRRSVTHVRPLAALRGATLVECRLETGRQHQVRIHLAELGHPLVGESVYIRDYGGARIAAPRTMLHARTLGFAHPRTGAALAFEREPPPDFAALLEKLQRRERE